MQIGFNRRLPSGQSIVMKPNPGGIAVPWVDVLRVDRMDGKRAVILFIYAAYPVIIHGSSKLISADFPGYAAQKLKARYGNDMLAMFAQACGAQINGEPLRGGFVGAEGAGNVLAEAAYQAAEESKPFAARRFTITPIRRSIKPVPFHL